jgi:alpha-L-fucosidase
MRKLAPNTIVFSDIGPDIRWVGNEKGIAGETNWNYLDTAGFKRGAGGPPEDTLNSGNYNGKNWIPAECDVSIRPGWFYHKEEDEKVKTPEQLFDLYLKSVGRGANLLLNVPPDRRGLINEHDSAALVGFKKLREESFSKNIATRGRGYFIEANDKKASAALNDQDAKTSQAISSSRNTAGIEFTIPQDINCVVLREDLRKGQFCSKFTVQLMNEKKEVIKTISGTTIGRKRILTFPATEVSSIAVKIDDQKATTLLGEIEAYLVDQRLIK